MDEPLEKGGPATEWRLAQVDEQARSQLADSLNLSPLMAQLLLSRGLSTPDEAWRFLKPSLQDLPSPFLLSDMDQAVARVERAIRAQELICIYGDYDLDGISASAVLMSFLSHYHARLRLFIPLRERDGYGLQQAPLERLIAEGVKLVITCDNGTSAHDEILLARAHGVDVIVTDHHTLPSTLPPAVAVLNPMRPETPASFRVLSGAGVAFMLVLGLRKTLRESMAHIQPPNLRRMLDLVTLGTVADVVPLTGVNRILVRVGLEELSARRRVGLQMLMNSAGIESDEEIGTMAVGFRLAPRLNAAGRLEDAAAAVELLLTNDSARAHELAGLLERLNRRRQTLEEEILGEIRDALKNMPDAHLRSSHVFGANHWHPGVVGVVAARLVEMTHRPGIVLAFPDTIGRGSARSIPGFDLMPALRGCAELLERYGGHAMAAGMSLHRDKLEQFRAQFEAASAQQLAERPRGRVLMIDANLDLNQVTESLLTDLEQLKPFGPGNVEPVFCSSNVRVLDQRTVGRGHLKLRLAQEGKILAGIGFRLAAKVGNIGAQGPVAMAFYPEFNTWRGGRNIQLRVTDLRVGGQLDNLRGERYSRPVTVSPKDERPWGPQR